MAIAKARASFLCCHRRAPSDLFTTTCHYAEKQGSRLRIGARDRGEQPPHRGPGRSHYRLVDRTHCTAGAPSPPGARRPVEPPPPIVRHPTHAPQRSPHPVADPLRQARARFLGRESNAGIILHDQDGDNLTHFPFRRRAQTVAVSHRLFIYLTGRRALPNQQVLLRSESAGASSSAVQLACSSRGLPKPSTAAHPPISTARRDLLAPTCIDLTGDDELPTVLDQTARRYC